jgi:phage gpG-like protein
VERVSTKVIDKGWNRIERELNKLVNMELQVGVIGKEDLAAIAMYNEFGTKHIPARPFMRLTFENKGDELKQRTAQAYVRIVEGSTATREANRIGAWYKSEVQRSIRSNIQPANADSTIARKKSNKTLIDTGRLRMAITFQIV